jgi:hypothetical protein
MRQRAGVASKDPRPSPGVNAANDSEAFRRTGSARACRKSSMRAFGPHASKRRLRTWAALGDHASVHVFLSHNSADKAVARRLGAQMRLAGADVWFDEWELRVGDSIPGKVNAALATVDTVILIWSSDANRSEWVRAEFESAIARGMDDQTLRVAPVILDDTPLPALLRRIRWVDLRDGDESRAVNEIMGFATDQDRLRAIQQVIDEAGLRVAYFQGYGPVVCCPRCGAGVDKLEGWSEIDDYRDDTYAGFRCTICGLTDGGEI